MILVELNSGLPVLMDAKTFSCSFIVFAGIMNSEDLFKMNYNTSEKIS